MAGRVARGYHSREEKTTMRSRIEKGFTKTGESLVSCDHNQMRATINIRNYHEELSMIKN